MRKLLADGILVVHAGFWTGRLRVLRCFGRNNVAGDHQYFSAEVSKRRHGNVRIFGLGRRFGRYGKFRNGRRHFQYVRRQSENRIARSISISADIDTGAGAP